MSSSRDTSGMPCEASVANELRLPTDVYATLVPSILAAMSLKDIAQYAGADSQPDVQKADNLEWHERRVAGEHFECSSPCSATHLGRCC